ncbi:TolC family protein [Psychromonas antarctica]|uniref:TolC family protein n=1 Tax=Psychromonas antarctica TaxID=67573 RepID=UPI001EE83A0C|nr:TolC family protein [Psychromonas antarctica]MCG6200508.1 TolC family protein [Psychromonas antarctica]
MFNKQRYKLLVATISLIIVFPVNAQQISFTDSWTLLQKKNNSIAAERANVERYQQLQKASESLNYPSVTLGANYTRLDDDITLSGDQLSEHLDTSGLSVEGGETLMGLLPVRSTMAEKDMFNSSIRAIWPIYTGGRISAAQSYASGKADEAIARLKMETQVRYQDLSKYYFSVVLAKQVLRTRQSVEKGLTQHRDFALKLEQQGQIAKVERLQAQASLAKAVVDRKKSQRDVDIATSALTEILNQKDKVIPQSTLFINRSLPSLAAFTEQTLATYPGLDILNAKDKQAESSVKAEKGKYYPEVYLYGDYVLYEDDSLTSEVTPDWFIGVGISVPLFENTGRSHTIQAAHSAVLQVRHLRQQAKQDLTVLVEKIYFGAQQAIEEVQGLDSSLALAVENLKLRKKAFNQGLSTSLDVIDAELYLASIKTQQQVASFNYIIALTKLLALSSDMSAFTQYESSSFQPGKSEDK